jgi:hypothetical protein
MTQLRPSSIENEYFLGGLPGTIQYEMSKDEILQCIPENLEEINDTEINDTQINENNSWNIAEHSLKNIQKSVPHKQTKFKNICDYRILLIMKHQNTNSTTCWYKIALINKNTEKIALFTSTNNKDELKRPINSQYEGYYIGHYRMSAPLYFWKELINRIKYSL